MCAESHFYVSKSTFSNRIFLLEKKAVIYEKASDSLMVLSVWALSVLLCFFHPQEGPARPVASSEWEENRLGWCLPHTASAWEAEAGRSEVRVQLWPHGETVSKTAEKKRKMSPVTPLLFSESIFFFAISCSTWDFGFPCGCGWRKVTCVMWWTLWCNSPSTLNIQEWRKITQRGV